MDRSVIIAKADHNNHHTVFYFLHVITKTTINLKHLAFLLCMYLRKLGQPTEKSSKREYLQMFPRLEIEACTLLLFYLLLRLSFFCLSSVVLLLLLFWFCFIFVFVREYLFSHFSAIHSWYCEHSVFLGFVPYRY